jgi:signal transduction histidine kinase
LFIAAAMYLVIIGWALVRRPVAGSAWPGLIAYAVLGAVMSALDAAHYAGQLPGWPAQVMAHLSLYQAFGFGLVLLFLTPAFLRVRAGRRRWFWFGLLWLAAAVLLDSDLLRLRPVLLRWSVGELERTALTFGVLVVGWAAAIGSSALVTMQTYRRTCQPLHRNRQAYWSVAIALSVAGLAVILAGQDAAGDLVLLAAGLVTALGVLTHQLPDVRQALRQTGVLVAAGGLAILVYSLVILTAPLIQRTFLGVDSALAAIAVAAVLVVGANPLLAWVQRRLARWASGARYDAQRIVGEYGLAIGGIVELERLANVALRLIREAVGIEQGALLVVDPPVLNANEAQFYRLRPAGSLREAPPAGALLADSPLAAYFLREFAPLTQYELDLHPRFQAVSTAERLWLQGMNVDLYVPIYASHQWIGLFALGPKLSRHRYFEADMRLLSTLADQTAVALQNARLVDDLTRLNHEIQAANSALDEANQRLAHLDRIKSDFINVISHELRTPMSILYGYGQILLSEVEERAGDDYQRQIIEGLNTGTTRMQEIIENMLDVSKIDSRALVLSAKPVSIELLVDQELSKLRRPLAERRLAVESSSLQALPSIEADAVALAKVFHHLVVNAVKFTPDGGQITVTGRCLDDELPGGAVEIAIHDTGIGIDPRFLDLIFTKFYQMGEVALHSTGKTKFKGGGPGLGLAIARGIVEAHGGRLRAESTGHDEMRLPGSRFVVLLPMAQPHSAASRQRS